MERMVTRVASKKQYKKQSSKARGKPRNTASGKLVRVYTIGPNQLLESLKAINKPSKDGDDLHPYPIRRNPEPPPEATRKKLEARKALTLRAFQMAYENHHRRKAS
jgi:hypothetical protein